MQNLTPTQQTDLTNWLKDTSQELPESLENVLIEHFLDRKNFDKLKPLFVKKFGYASRIGNIYCDQHGIYFDHAHYEETEEDTKFSDLSETEKTIVLLTLLSRTAPTPEKPNGEAVIPFLDKLTNIVTSKGEIPCGKYFIPFEGRKTFQELLLETFTKVCFGQGKGLEKARIETTKTYLIQLYT